MVRPIYAHEMCDPDFSWLINTFRENNPDYVPVESTCLPVVLINFKTEDSSETADFEREEYPEISEEESAKDPHKGTP